MRRAPHAPLSRRARSFSGSPSGVCVDGSGRKESHLRPRGYQPRALTAELRPEKMYCFAARGSCTPTLSGLSRACLLFHQGGVPGESRSGRRGSHPRPRGWGPRVLLAELRPHLGDPRGRSRTYGALTSFRFTVGIRPLRDYAWERRGRRGSHPHHRHGRPAFYCLNHVRKGWARQGSHLRPSLCGRDALLAELRARNW